MSNAESTNTAPSEELPAQPCEQSPQLISLELLFQVVGGSPRGTWGTNEVQAIATESPRGTW
jgi:hypothetical protein